MLIAKQYNGSTDVSFARKGEARPMGASGQPIPFPVRPLPTAGGRGDGDDAGAGEPVSRIPLSMLIQRSSAAPLPVASVAPAHAGIDPAAPVPADPTTVDLQLLSRPPVRRGRGPAAAPAEPRRKLTFRLGLEECQALDALRSRMATTYQALLERAALALIGRNAKG